MPPELRIFGNPSPRRHPQGLRAPGDPGASQETKESQLARTQAALMIFLKKTARSVERYPKREH